MPGASNGGSWLRESESTKRLQEEEDGSAAAAAAAAPTQLPLSVSLCLSVSLSESLVPDNYSQSLSATNAGLAISMTLHYRELEKHKF
jgi:hypothetical protein